MQGSGIFPFELLYVSLTRANNLYKCNTACSFHAIKRLTLFYPNRSSVSVQRSGARLFGVGYTVWYHRLA